MHLHYSVNGGPDQDVNLLKQPGAKDADGCYTLRLEDFKLVPATWSASMPRRKTVTPRRSTDITLHPGRSV